MKSFKITDIVGAYVMALRCKHCEEFYSNQKDVASISENESCRECLTLQDMGASELAEEAF